MLDEQDRRVDDMHARRMMNAVLEGEEEERRLRLKQQDEHAALARMQKKQLEEYKQRYIEELREVTEFDLELRWPSVQLTCVTQCVGKARRRADEGAGREGCARRGAE